MNIVDTVTYGPVTVYPREREFIENFVMGDRFPWYWQGNQTFDDPDLYIEQIPEDLRPFVSYYNGQFLSHQLLKRAEIASISHLDRPASDFSPYYEFFIEIFYRFVTEHGIKPRTIYRANLNLNWHNGYMHTEPHYDHQFPHSNFIMYLNDCENGQTIVWPEDFSASYMFPCKQYTAITFKQKWHGHRYPAPRSRRVAFVVTYI